MIRTHTDRQADFQRYKQPHTRTHTDTPKCMCIQHDDLISSLSGRRVG
jgi:hypothetical protein